MGMFNYCNWIKYISLISKQKLLLQGFALLLVLDFIPIGNDFIAIGPFHLLLANFSLLLVFENLKILLFKKLLINQITLFIYFISKSYLYYSFFDLLLFYLGFYFNFQNQLLQAYSCGDFGLFGCFPLIKFCTYLDDCRLEQVVEARLEQIHQA